MRRSTSVNEYVSLFIVATNKDVAFKIMAVAFESWWMRGPTRLIGFFIATSCVRLLLFISASTAFRFLEVLFCVFCHSAEVATYFNTLDRRVIIRTQRSLDLSCCSIVNAENCLKDNYSIMLKSDRFFSMEILYLTILSLDSCTLQVIVTDRVP